MSGYFRLVDDGALLAELKQAAARLPWFHVVGLFGQQPADRKPWFSRSTTLPEPLDTSLPSIEALEDKLSRGLVGEES